jgi:magnesium transporter
MISLYCWNPSQKAGLLLNPELLSTHAEKLRAGQEMYWIDLENPTQEEEDLVLDHFFRVHRLTREDMSRQRRDPHALAHFPKAEAFPDYLFVIVNPLNTRFLDKIVGKVPVEEDVPAATQLGAVLTERVLITYHQDPLSAVQNLRTFLEKHEEQAGRGPDYLFHLILDAMVDEFAPALDHFDDVLDRMEAQIFARPTQHLLVRLLALKRDIIALRKTLVYQREVLARLARGDFELIDEREMAYYRNVYDHVVRFTELIESSREMVADLMQTHLSSSSNKLNQIMKVFTMISTVILPMTLIAGIYGMNFEKNVLPDFRESEYGFWVALLLMLASGITSLALFKWRGWF